MKRSVTFRMLAGGICLSATLLACSTPDGTLAPDPPCNALRQDTPATNANVVLIINDTMRRDRVGLHGGSARTPALDAFAKQNLYFTNAFTNAPWTKPAVATLLTSLYPSQHGLTSHPELRSDMGVEGGGRS